MNDLNKVLQFFHLIEKLKVVQRKIKVSDRTRLENPAEHSWRVAVMATVLHDKLKLELDLLKTLKMILIHDLVEIIADDVWIQEKDNHAQIQEKQQKERKAAAEIFAVLPAEIGSDLHSLWAEFEASRTSEARFAHALDKIEVIIQRIDLGAKNWDSPDIYPVAQHWADEAIMQCPDLKPLWDLVQRELATDFMRA